MGVHCFCSPGHGSLCLLCPNLHNKKDDPALPESFRGKRIQGSGLPIQLFWIKRKRKDEIKLREIWRCKLLTQEKPIQVRFANRQYAEWGQHIFHQSITCEGVFFPWEKLLLREGLLLEGKLWEIYWAGNRILRRRGMEEEEKNNEYHFQLLFHSGQHSKDLENCWRGIRRNGKIVQKINSWKNLQCWYIGSLWQYFFQCHARMFLWQQVQSRKNSGNFHRQVYE